MGGVPPPLTPSPFPPDSLLDDIVLTHSLFLPTERFLQQLHQQYPWGGAWGGHEGGKGCDESGREGATRGARGCGDEGWMLGTGRARW